MLSRERSRSRMIRVCQRVTAFVAFALPTGLWGCPAFQSDDFRIVAASDAGFDEVGSGDGTLPETATPGRGEGPTDVLAEALSDDGSQADAVPTEDTTPDAPSLDADATIEGAAPEAGSDANPDAAVDACTLVPMMPFGCGSTGYQFPTQYCVYRSGINGNPDTTVGMPTPTACQCSGGYTCSCLVASGQTLCPADTPTYINCQTGTTGGVVVGCQGAPADAASDATSDAVLGCTANTRKCNGNAIMICNSNGQWQEATRCPNTCSNGVCI
jgi:hypothetical protein